MGVPFVGFPLYKYVVGGVKGDCRNIFHERSVCGFLRAVLEQQHQASLVVWRYVSTGANLKWDNFYICTCDVWNEVGIFFGFSCVGVQNISFEWDGQLKNTQLVC